jgi:hypothetical protein
MPNKPKSDSRPSSRVLTLPDPENMPFSTHAEQGGTLQWRIDSHNYPEFEIRFQGPNPSNANKNLVLKGSDARPVVLRLKTIGVYKYTVRHIKKDGTSPDPGPVLQPVLSIIVHCVGCPPWMPGT